MGHEDVAAREGEKLGQLLAPPEGAVHVVRADAVDAGVPFHELVVARRRLDEPPDALDDLAIAHLDEADRACARAGAVRRLEVDRREVQGHVPSLARGTDSEARARRNPPHPPR